MTKRFTETQLNQLRAQYAGIKTIDPGLPAYARLIALLDGLTVAQLKQLRDARIPNLWLLASNRIPKVRA